MDTEINTLVRMLILCCGAPVMLVVSIATSLLGGFWGLPRERIEEEQ